MRYARYAALRLMSCAAVVFLGITVMYLLPMIKRDMGYDLSIEGYFGFLKDMAHMDMGMSKFYRSEVAPIVWRYLPYTLLLCVFSSVVAWIVGNAVGLAAGCARGSAAAKLAEGAAMVIYPIPYFILALVVQVVFAFLLGLFPITGEIMTNQGAARFVTTLLRSSCLPALTMILSGTGWWVISMSALSSSARDEEFVRFAYLRGVKPGRVKRDYIRKGCMGVQYTALAIQLGTAFGGSIMTEMIFGYPGVGFLMQRAAMNNDYALLYGASIVSLIAIALSTTLMDLIYPLLDPRVRV